MSPPSTSRPRADGALYSIVICVPPMVTLVSAVGLSSFWVTCRLPVCAVNIATAASAIAANDRIFICAPRMEVTTLLFDFCRLRRDGLPPAIAFDKNVDPRVTSAAVLTRAGDDRGNSEDPDLHRSQLNGLPGHCS